MINDMVSHESVNKHVTVAVHVGATLALLLVVAIPVVLIEGGPEAEGIVYLVWYLL